MRELWLKTFELFRRHPVLWAPYACAMLSVSFLGSLRDDARRAIFRWLTESHQHRSVLGGSFSAQSSEVASMRRYAEIRSCLEWGTRFIDICIFATALVLTTILLRELLAGKKIGFAPAVKELRAYRGRIVVYSAKYWLVYLALNLPILITVRYLLEMLLHLRSWVGSAVFAGLDLLEGLCLAWIIAPIALELIRPASGAYASKQIRKLARYCFMMTVIAVLVLGRALRPVFEMLSHGSIAGQFGLKYLSPLFIEFPYVMLYIALTLLAAAAPLNIGSELPFRLPQLIKNLMPLHYPPADEEQ